MRYRTSSGLLSRLGSQVHALALVGLMCAAGSQASAQALPHNIPDFSADGSRAAVRSVGSGDWSNPATWQSGTVPTANHVVHVDPGHTVTIDTTAAVAYTLAVHGTLRVNPAVNTRLTVTNLMVMGDHGMPSMANVGRLEVGTAAAPVAAGVTAEIVITNTATGGGVADPEQFGTGIINFGKLTMHGAPLSTTFLRLAVEPRVGHTTLTLSAAVTGWRAGDRIVIPDTRHIKESEVTGSGWINAVNQWEERTIQSISADGRTLTLTSALSFDHLGARDQNNVLDFLPHVGSLTRNVVVRSASASGTRGHMMSVHTADTDIRYALFRDLGRTKYTPLNTTTNVIGRYPIHMHHNRGPLPTPANGYQFTLIGNAVDGGSAATQFKWGITIHNSHYGLIQDNVVYNYNGSSIATEDGSESFNVFDHNFALRGMGEPNNAVDEARSAMGTEGVGFWFRGANNYVRNNVAANFQNPTTEAAYGFVYQLIRLGNVATPNFKGADPAVAGQFTTRNGNNMPMLQFENNEVYGATQGGFTYWWVSSLDPQPYANAQESLVKNLKIWHVYNKAVYHYPSAKITFDGLIIRGKFDALARCCGNGVYGADYSTKAVIIRNSDIQGMDEGISFPEAGFGPEPNLTVENSYLRNDNNIQVPTNGSVNGCWMENKLVVISNTRFEAPPGRSLNNIAMVRDVGYAPECLSKLDEARVYAYNGVATDNFQVYHSSSSVLPRPPGSCSPTTRAGISGLLCPIAALGPVAPTVTMTASPASITTGQSSTLTWAATNATTVSINQGIGTVAASGTRTVSPAATMTYTVTATNAVGSITATATVTVGTAPAPVPTVSLTASPATIASGATSTLTWTTGNATTVSINQGIGTVATSGTRSVTPTASTTYTLTATNASGSATATATVSVNAVTTAHTRDRANAYDDAWQGGANGWVANAKAILSGATGQVPGMVMWIGDSLTRDPALGAWAQGGAGKTAEDQMIAAWMHAGLSPRSIDSVDGFALAAPYHCSARSYTVGDGLGSWHFMGTGMPTDTNPTTAKQKLENCTAYPNVLNLRTMLTALQKPQFAIPEVNLDAANPGSFPDFEAMVDLMIAKGIVPIIITYTYRTDAAFNLLVDQYNAALIQYAQTKKLPLIDLNREMLLRLPFAQWPGRFLSDGVHYTKGTTTYPSTSDPYATGGDSATHTTGIALTYDGYGLKGWLGVQKMKEIKQLVVDGLAPAAIPTVTLGASPLSVAQGQSSTLTWTTTGATSVTINQGIGAVTASGTRSVSPTATTTYTITATNAAGSAAATATVTVTPPPTPTSTPTVTLTASPVSIAAGAASTLTWAAANATSVSINQGIGAVTASGTRSVSPAATTTYTITATNAGGSVTATATVTVTPTPTPTPAPTVTLVASPASIVTGAASTLTWAATNATSVSINRGIGTVTASGTSSVSPTATTTYTITATNAAGSATANATVSVNGCSLTLSTATAGVPHIGGGGTVTVTASSGMCAWTTDSDAAWLTTAGGGTGNGTFTYTAAANSAAARTGTVTVGGATFVVTQAAPPVMTVDHASLAFGVVNSAGTLSPLTQSQTIGVTVTGASPAWTAATTTPWLQVGSGSGVGTGSFTVSVSGAAGLPATGTVSGAVVITSAGSVNAPMTIGVTLTLFASTGTTTAPFGSFDTPVSGTEVAGSIAVTGWSLDDVEVTRVEIWRDLVAGETTPGYAGGGLGSGKVFIANAFFIDGARPDVELAYGTLPLAYRAGWGYLMLTQGLWNQGNGTYTLHAFAYDKDGHGATLGSKVVTSNNATATRPFGGIDRPAYGETVTTSLWNFGWALTPAGAANCTIGAGGVRVSIDSGPLVPVSYGDQRSDIAAGFPGFTNGAGAGGAYYLDLATLANGTHQIGWYVVDSCGRADGIGSRFFTVLKGAADASGDTPSGLSFTAAKSTAADAIAANVASGFSRTLDAPIDLRRGVETALVYPGASGARLVPIGVGDRVEMHLPAIDGAGYSAYQVVEGTRRPLPLGSSFDAATGVFYWQPGAGFLGAYQLEFAASRGGVIRVRAVVGTAVQAVIDTPQAGNVSSSFTIAGWAIDEAARSGTGIDTVHVWAYPATGAAPIFLGVAAYGDARPDIGAVFGDQFTGSSYSLGVNGLPPGTYDLVVYPHSAVTGDFHGARVVRVTVR